ncbi:MAG: amino acid permease [Bdellovibrionaceae bacterium]|nr:amino acid permease [Pseudobdellovibrionaceae bacterium]|tara:strand:- start:632 stop:2467 length:1836 start_codon:yes stop_codon:yes gene_type:complete
MEQWNFAGWGSSHILKDLDEPKPSGVTELGVPREQVHKLSEWPSTAICGNDILSSCLYVSALTIKHAGILAPLALLLVAGLLYLYRRIYGEVISALPLNGGTYTVLINTTTKTTAAAAACLTILSYLATAVISAGEAMHYLHALIEWLPVIPATLALLGFFAFLNLIGISESSKVALGIFITHITSLVLLVLASLIFVIADPSILFANFSTGNFSGHGFFTALFIGFSTAMLGVSGFESSANFVEEQQRGVFPKTLKNMWLGVLIFNPAICFLALAVLPIDQAMQNPTSLLATLGFQSGGHWLKTLIGIDAVLVLSGAVLTSYVGVIGLCRRMALDRCLPQIFLRENQWKKTNHWIILGFFALCSVILLYTNGQVDKLAGVYTLSFLLVMALFALGNMFMKIHRHRLPRDEKASWLMTLVAFVAVVIAIVGNLSPENLETFFIFYLLIGAGVFLMFKRVPLLQVTLFALENAADFSPLIKAKVERNLKRWIKKIGKAPVVYFTKGDNLQVLNQAALYVLNNEQTRRLIVVHVFETEADIPKTLAPQLYTIDHLYPELKIDFIGVKGKFSPQLIEAISNRLRVPKNYMFIGTPGDRFPHEIETLGGVRLIIG